MEPQASESVPSRPTSLAPALTPLNDHEVECQHLHIMLPYKCLAQPEIHTHVHLKIGMVCPILMTVNDPEPTTPRLHQEVLKLWLIS